MTPLPAPPGAIDEIFRRAHRRRLRHSAASACAVLVTLAVSVSAHPGLPSGADRLDVAATTTPEPAPAYAGRSPAPRLASSAPRPSGSGRTAVRTSPAPAVTPEPDVSPSAPPAARAEMTRWTEQQVDCRAIADPEASTTRDALCAVLDVQQHPAYTGLRWIVCLQPGAVQSTLSFDTALETDFVVRDAPGDVVWQWSRGREFAGIAHTLTLGLHDCVYWSVDWRGDDDSGRPLPPGHYRIEGFSQAAELAGVTLEVAVDVG